MLIEFITVVIDTGKELRFDMRKWTHVQTSSGVLFRSNDGKREWSIGIDHVSAVFREGKPK